MAKAMQKEQHDTIQRNHDKASQMIKDMSARRASVSRNNQSNFNKTRNTIDGEMMSSRSAGGLLANVRLRTDAEANIFSMGASGHSKSV